MVVVRGGGGGRVDDGSLLTKQVYSRHKFYYLYTFIGSCKTVKPRSSLNLLSDHACGYFLTAVCGGLGLPHELYIY